MAEEGITMKSQKQKRLRSSSSQVQESFIQAHMHNHYQRLYSAKAVVDTSAPRSLKKRRRLPQNGLTGVSHMEPQHRTHRISSSQGACKTGMEYLDTEAERMLLMKRPSLDCKEQVKGMIQTNPAVPRDKKNRAMNDIHDVLVSSSAYPHTSALTASERISIFLDSVQQEEEMRMLKKVMYEKEQKSYLDLSQGTVMSRTFPASSQLLQKTHSSSNIVDRHAGCFQHASQSCKPMVPVKNARSRLVDSRVYNPPRRRKKAQKSQNMKQKRMDTAFQTPSFPHTLPSYCQPPVVPPLEIGPDSDQEEWLHEQAIRGQARQWMAQEMQLVQTVADPFTYSRSNQVTNTLISNGKESSKDSAYNGGFSSGESRAPTRGPTPDHYIGFKKGQKYPGFQSNNHISYSSAVQSSVKKKKVQQEKKDQEYLMFLSDVTSDILTRGIYTNKGLKQVFQTHVEKRNGELEMGRMLDMIEKLRIDLGIPKDDSLNGIEFGVGCLDYGKKCTFRYCSANDSTVSGSCVTKPDLKQAVKSEGVKRCKEKLDLKQSSVILEESSAITKQSDATEECLTADVVKNVAAADFLSESELCHILEDLDLDQAMTAEILELMKQPDSCEEEFCHTSVTKTVRHDDVSHGGSVKSDHAKCRTDRTRKHQEACSDTVVVTSSKRTVWNDSCVAEGTSSRTNEKATIYSQENASDGKLVSVRTAHQNSVDHDTDNTRSNGSDAEEDTDSVVGEQYSEPLGSALGCASEESETDLYSQSDCSSQDDRRGSQRSGDSDDGSC